MRTQYSLKDIKIDIVRLFNEGKEMNYVLGWLRGMNESDRFTDEGYQLLQSYAIDVFIFRIKVDLNNKGGF